MWAPGVKYHILSEKVPVPREVMSRVGRNVGEPKKCIKCHRKIALNKGGMSGRESQALEMAYIVLMSNMPLGVGRKRQLMERPLRNLITAG